MKTEREQIERMAEIIKNDYKQWLDITGVFPEGSLYYFECLGGGFDCARLLYEAGYGDVSEYKAEIERLKTKIIKQDQTIIESNFELSELEEKNKQAQIDVLNKAKEKLDSAPNGWAYTGYIDDLIEEVEK